jgi:DNA repair protein RadC
VASPSLRLIRELPADERPRERLQLRGAAGLTSAELVGLLWGSGGRGRSAVDVAGDAMARFEGLTGLARASGPELESIPGVGVARAAQLQAAFELGRRLLADWPAGRWSIRSPRDVADRLVLQMGRLEREELRVVILNTKNPGQSTADISGLCRQYGISIWPDPLAIDPGECPQSRRRCRANRKR